MSSKGSSIEDSISVSSLLPFLVPDWCRHFTKIPEYRISLGNLPTPLHRWKTTSMVQTSLSDNVYESLSVKQVFNLLNITLIMKRDDMSGGCELGGNKVRKLEFLLADCINRQFTTIITIGGEQSNHCRATATAARMVGIEPNLILRTRKHRNISMATTDDGDWLGSTGNLLFDRIVGANIYTCTPREYNDIGSNELIRRLSQYLLSTDPSKHRKIYPIPVGGSNGLGTWGYIQAVDEILKQMAVGESTNGLHIVFATGSGGTAAGITLGMILACHHYNLPLPTMHAVGVCDDPDYFYKCIADIAQDMGFKVPYSIPHESFTESSESSSQTTEQFIRTFLKVYQGKGFGYATSSKEELDFISIFAKEYGVVLDPVYSGKAFYYFLTQVLRNNEQEFRNSSVLFWHTGGSLGLYDKVSDLQITSAVTPLLEKWKLIENSDDGKSAPI